MAQHLDGAIARIDDPDVGSLPAPCVVPRIVGQRIDPPRSGPAIGEHNAEIYGALGLDAAALAELTSQGVI